MLTTLCRRICFVFFALLFVAFPLAVPMHAQNAADIAIHDAIVHKGIGAKVRLVRKDNTWAVGKIVAINDESVDVKEPTGIRTVRYDEITEIRNPIHSKGYIKYLIATPIIIVGTAIMILLIAWH